LSRPELDEAYLLLRKAREDAEAVRKFATDPDLADAVVGFHAQQAVEKALKAVLAALWRRLPLDARRASSHGAARRRENTAAGFARRHSRARPLGRRVSLWRARCCG
jgi:HEPN domain-containing protein